jgi:hypothetical protein
MPHRRHANVIVYHIETKLNTSLPQSLIHDIYSNVERASRETIDWNGNYKEKYDKLREANFPYKWNELRIRLARMKTKEMDEVLDLMHMLDDGVSIR